MNHHHAQTLWTGHEDDIAATERGTLKGKFFTLRVRVGGSAPGTLAHPCLPLGRQADGSVVLEAIAYRQFQRSLQAVTADVLATVFMPRGPNWAEAALGDPPAWRVEWDDCRQPLVGFGAGQICDYWDGR